MSATDVFLVNAFEDLKMKSSGGGGFSDGGVLNRSISFKEPGENPVVIEIAPPKGIVLSGVALGPFADLSGLNSVSVVNFGPTNNVSIQEFFVQEDGTEHFFNSITVSALNVNGVSSYFGIGGKLQYPNMLRYKLLPIKGPLPAGRVLLKYTLLQYDRPADQTL